MSHTVGEEMTFDDIATLYEDNQDEFTSLFLQDVSFYNFTKDEAVEEVDGTIQMINTLPGIAEISSIDISHEETSSSYCYTEEASRSPESDGSFSFTNPENRKNSKGARKNRTPNTLRHIMEKHRHSERIRHHSLNERLKAICQLIPGSADDNRETKVVMMQRVISYIAFLENTIRFLCGAVGTQPHPNWVVLTNNFSQYFHDYFKGFEDLGDADTGDAEVLEATENLSRSMESDESVELPYGGRMKVSSPTVDSTTDSVVPVMVPHVEREVTVLSQDSGVPSSSVGGDEDQAARLWELYGGVVNPRDGNVFFSSLADDSVSAVLEITSSTNEDQIILDLDDGSGYQEDPDDVTLYGPPQTAVSKPSEYSFAPSQPIQSFYTVEKNVPKPAAKVSRRRNKRKQLSPRRSPSEEDYLLDRAYLPSWPTQTQHSGLLPSSGDRSAGRLRALPYNIRCNHRYPIQRLQAVRSREDQTYPPPALSLAPVPPKVNRAPEPEIEDKQSSKLDLRKTSWMNGFMMFSRLNRRKFIQAHPGVHTSHISKIMGHTWRNMKREEQAPYKEKAKLCAQELYRAYTSQPEFSQCPPISSASANSGAADSLSPAISTFAPDAFRVEPMAVE